MTSDTSEKRQKEGDEKRNQTEETSRRTSKNKENKNHFKSKYFNICMMIILLPVEM